jgi:hypothetical protein
MSCQCDVTDDGIIVYCPMHVAAPDLLAAVKCAEKFIDDMFIFGYVKDEHVKSGLQAIRDIAIEASAKAGGR